MTVVFQHELLRKRRKEQHLTQEMLAEFCGCSPRYLRDLEAGVKQNPSAVLVRQMACALGISVEELLVFQREEYEYLPHHPAAYMRF